MEIKGDTINALKRATLTELWSEIGKRFRIQYGRIQMAFHKGLPSEYAELDLRVYENDLDKEKRFGN